MTYRTARTGQDAAHFNFVRYLRTGRLTTFGAGDGVEQKFNPYHDPRNGQFTFAPGGPRGPNAGTGFGGTTGSASRIPGSNPSSNMPGQPRGRWLVSYDSDVSQGVSYAAASPSKFSAAHPDNHSIHVVRKGESLSRIAARRKGLRTTDLAELNGLNPLRPIQPGQRVKIPHQRYLDAGKAARDKFIKLEYYRSVHCGRLPPNPSNPPEIHDPANWIRTTKNGYEFSLDASFRTRKVSGRIVLNPHQARSRLEQSRAGGKYRKPTDEGGHYIAREFNGPTDAFNHYAQNRNFNRSGYRKLELIWKKSANQGQKVSVDIRPLYKGNSLRPSHIIVVYKIDGSLLVKQFANGPRGK